MNVHESCNFQILWLNDTFIAEIDLINCHDYDVLKWRNTLEISLFQQNPKHTHIQWRIQDFPGGTNLLFGIFLPETAWKWKEKELGGGPSRSLDPPLTYHQYCWEWEETSRVVDPNFDIKWHWYREQHAHFIFISMRGIYLTWTHLKNKYTFQ